MVKATYRIYYHAFNKNLNKQRCTDPDALWSKVIENIVFNILIDFLKCPVLSWFAYTCSAHNELYFHDWICNCFPPSYN